MVPAIAVLVLLVVIGAISAGTAAARRTKEKRLSKLRVIADFLGGQHDDSGKAWGAKFGPKTTCEFTTRGAGSSSENWTHLHVEIPIAYPLAVHVRRHQGGDQRKVARGDMVDVVVGEPVFDAAFLVEAAPSDVVRELLDSEIRGLLLAHKEIDLDTVETDGSRALVLGLRGWLEEVEQVSGPLEVMGRLGSRVRDAYARADAALERSGSGDPYRPAAEAAPLREVQAAREAEVGNIAAVRKRRASEAAAIAMLVLGIVLFITIATTCGSR